MNSLALGLLALLPALVGPLPDPSRPIVVAAMCQSGERVSVRIRFGDEEGPPPQPCFAKACHGFGNRKKFDLPQ